jgi:hypothetical protein
MGFINPIDFYKKKIVIWSKDECAYSSFAWIWNTMQFLFSTDCIWKHNYETNQLYHETSRFIVQTSRYVTLLYLRVHLTTTMTVYHSLSVKKAFKVIRWYRCINLRHPIHQYFYLHSSFFTMYSLPPFQMTCSFVFYTFLLLCNKYIYLVYCGASYIIYHHIDHLDRTCGANLPRSYMGGTDPKVKKTYIISVSSNFII